MVTVSGSERVIMRGGPLHRRVYPAAELDRVPSARQYEDTGKFWRLGDIYKGLGVTAGDEQVRVLVHRDGPDAPARRDVYVPPSSGPGGFPRTCTRLGCEEAATHRVWGDYDREWFGCAAHHAGMAAAFKVGRSDGYYVHDDPL